MATLYRYNGILLQKGGALAVSEACCCDCNCCGADPATAAITAVSLEWVSPTLGNSTGTYVAGSGSFTQTSSPNSSCVGRFDFSMLYSNGACQAQDTRAAYAQLYHANDPDIGNCCYWEVNFYEEPDALCGGVGPDNLNDGFPTNATALVISCGGSQVPDSCISLTSYDGCFPYCSAGGFSFVNFTTNLAGNCFCPGDVGQV